MIGHLHQIPKKSIFAGFIQREGEKTKARQSQGLCSRGERDDENVSKGGGGRGRRQNKDHNSHDGSYDEPKQSGGAGGHFIINNFFGRSKCYVFIGK